MGSAAQNLPAQRQAAASVAAVTASVGTWRFAPEQTLQPQTATPAAVAAAAESRFAAQAEQRSRVPNHPAALEMTDRRMSNQRPAPDAAAAAAAVAAAGVNSAVAASADTTCSAFGQPQQIQIDPVQLRVAQSAAIAALSCSGAAGPAAAGPGAVEAASAASSAAAAAASAGIIYSAHPQTQLSRTD